RPPHRGHPGHDRPGVLAHDLAEDRADGVGERGTQPLRDLVVQPVLEERDLDVRHVPPPPATIVDSRQQPGYGQRTYGEEGVVAEAAAALPHGAPLARTSYADQAHEAIRTWIVSGELPMG